MPFVMTMSQKRALNKANAPESKNLDGKKPAWESAEIRDNVTFRKSVTHKGLTYKLYVGSSETPAVLKEKTKILHAAIEGMQKSGVMFANSEVKEFKVVLYGDNGYMGKQASRGVVWYDSASEPKPSVMLQLGSRICYHIRSTDSASPSQGGAAGGKCTPARVVADRFYDYYKKTFRVKASDRCAVAQAYHELGHIFHQLTAADAYLVGADVFRGQVKTVDNGGQWSTRHKNVDAKKDTIATVARLAVSQYADTGGTNEFVAEVFSGMMMGVPWDSIDANVMKYYNALSGPKANPDHKISRLKNFIAQKCIRAKATTGEMVVYYGSWG